MTGARVRRSRKTPSRFVEPICVECGGRGVLAIGTSGRKTGLGVYVCKCGARVGARPGDSLPLGFPCGPETSIARDRAHKAFDPIWQETPDKKNARETAYKWLARELGIAREECHIGRFNRSTCDLVISICAARRSVT